MKSLLVTIICFAFFLVNTGFVVNLHYCMDKLHSWQLGTEESEKCGKCGMGTSEGDGCCRDEVKVIKLQQDVVSSQYVTTGVVSPTFFQSFVSAFLLPVPANGSPDPAYLSYRPPLIGQHKIYISNRVFLI